MRKILLVEDDPVISTVICDVLICDGFDVTPTDSATTALKLLNNSVFDLIITDVLMPSVDGISFLFSIRKIDGGFPCKVIVISGGGVLKGKNYLDIVKSLNVDAVFEKPLNFDELSQEVSKLIPENPL